MLSSGSRRRGLDVASVASSSHGDLRALLVSPHDQAEDFEGELGAAERERLTTVARTMTESLLQATDLLGGIPWSLVHEKHGISLFRADMGNQPAGVSTPCNVHAVCKFACEIEDVAESLITNSTQSFKQMMGMLSSDFLDGAVVQDIVVPNELNPHRYVALKWAAFKSSSPFARDRDFVMLEYVDMIEDAQGQKIAFRIMESVDVPGNSRYAESPKYSRDVVPLMGFMYHTTKKPGELRMTYTCHFDKNGDLPAWAANSAIQSHVEKCINGILKYIDRFRVNKESIVLPQQVIMMSELDHCCICKKNFCVLRRRYNCLRCGEVICSSCSSVRTAHVADIGERQLRICTACVLESRRTVRPSPDSPAAFGTPRGCATFVSATEASEVGSSRGASTSRLASFSHSVAGSSCSTPKRRSYDDVLDPVRSRLIEYKTFSTATERGGVSLKKSSFPLRSFSDGLVMRREALFTKRRGSPADLAISIEAFRLHRARMGGDQLVDDGDLSSDDGSSPWSPTTTRSSAATSSKSPCREGRDDLLSPLQATRPVIEGGDDHSRKLKSFESESNQLSLSPPLSPISDCSATDSSRSLELSAAMEMAQDIIVATQRAHTLAQRVRKLSHHRVLALQQEEMGSDSSQRSDNQSQHGRSPRRDDKSDKSGRRIAQCAMSPSKGGEGAILFSSDDLKTSKLSPSRSDADGSNNNNNNNNTDATASRTGSTRSISRSAHK